MKALRGFRAVRAMEHGDNYVWKRGKRCEQARAN